ncbi:hypothetical protein [Mycobacterium aquaticum]|uniref:Proline rich protein n=1 Tax=Mycobacterium aquaticum TaxID=1927124 RepID=A0A1X0AXE4_9MYCO|nr:hypothetical protein [Mycobacterium aquaticum]ORA34585.1 hypothetical protein BST13_16325 [Mycobacterium aquaticum]
MTDTSSEPTGPVATAEPPVTAPPAAPAVVEERRPNRLFQALAWVGIAAGTVFIVAVVFGTGFFLGAHSGGGHHHHGGGGWERPGMMFHHHGGWGQGGPGQQGGPGAPGQGGPGFGPGGPAGPGGQPGAPTTTPSR